MIGSTNSDKKLGFWTVMSLVVGSSVGAGIFMIPASLASFGGIGLLGWVFTALGTLLLVLSFVRLSSKNPAAGGPYAYARQGFGDFIGFQVAWNYWISTCISNAALAVGLSAYMSVFFPTIESIPWLGFAIAATGIWGVTLLNIAGIYQSAIFQLVFTILKLIPIFLVISFGLPKIEMANFEPFNTTGMNPYLAIMGASTITLWAFLGFEAGTVPAGNIENPERNIPRATFWGTLVVIAVCIFSSMVVMGILPNAYLQHATAPFSEVAQKLFGQWGAWLIGVGAIISTIGTMNALALLQGQIPLAAAKDALMPKLFKKQNAQGAPYMGLTVSSLIITGVVFMRYTETLVNQFTFLLLLSTLTALITYLFPILTDLKSLFQNKKNALALGGTFLAFCYLLWAILGAGQDQIFLGSLLFFGSTPIYVWMKLTYHREEKGRASN